MISENYYGKWFGFCDLMLLSVNWEFFPHLSGKCQFFTSSFPVVPVRVRGFFHTQRRYNGRAAPVRCPCRAVSVFVISMHKKAATTSLVLAP